MIICCTLLTAFSACVRESIEIVQPQAEGNIILRVSANDSPITKAPDQNALETKIERLDVFIFNTADDNKKVCHEFFNNPADTKGEITLSEDRKNFNSGPYYVYLIANSNEETVAKFGTVNDLNDLKTVYQEDPSIHVTGLVSDKNDLPTSFLMDGAAYLDGEGVTEPKQPQSIELYNGRDDENTELAVTLRRAAAKIVVNIKKGEDVAYFDPSNKTVYMIKNMPSQSSVLAEVTAPAKPINTQNANNAYLTHKNDNISLTAYTYSYDWSKADVFEEVRILMNIPMFFNGETQPEVSEGEEVQSRNNWYQIPISKDKVLKRNHYYQIDVTINTRGTESEDDAIILDDITYNTYAWTPVGINVGTDAVNRPKFLVVNKKEVEMYNTSTDYTLEFASSHDVEVKIINYYFFNKFGKPIERYKYSGNTRTEINEDSFWDVLLKETPVSGGENTNGTTPYYWTNSYYYNNSERINWLRKSGVPISRWAEIKGLDGYESFTYNKVTFVEEDQIKVEADPGLNGNIKIISPEPINNTIRYIEIEVRNNNGTPDNEEDDIVRNVIVKQYPLIYITNTQGWYSYRKDFGGTTYESYGKEGITDVDYSSSNGYTYNNYSGSFWFSKVAGPAGENGKSLIEEYSWTSSTTVDPSQTEMNNSSGSENAKMYHVQITTAGLDAEVNGKLYTIGRPRMTLPDSKGLRYTDDGDDNALLVSPSFMIASRLGKLVAVNVILSLDVVRNHCANYVEVYKDEDGNTIVLDDWRLPTTAELKIIMDLQGTSSANADAIDYLLNARAYYSASGPVDNDKSNSSSDSVRCIRDAY